MYLLVSCLMLWGCGILGPGTKDSSADDDVKVVKTPTEVAPKVDTIEWTYASEEEYPPIRDRNTMPVGEFKDVYNVVLLAPFGASRLQSTSDRVSSRMLRMIEFLCGMEYGLEHSIRGVGIQLDVIDTQDDPAVSEYLLNRPEMLNADVIIGPYYTELLSRVSQFAADNQKVLISPWNTSKLEQKNQLYVQMRPSLEVHSRKIASYVKSKYSEEEILLLTKNNERDIETLQYFQDTITKNEFGIPSDSIAEVVIPDIGNSEWVDTLMAEISRAGYRAFIIPVWQDEPFVIATLSKLNVATAEEGEVEVFGLPQWMTMNRMDYEYFENLNVHLSSAKPFKYNTEDARGLRSSYFEGYGDLPGPDAFYGLDLIKWLAGQLQLSGTGFMQTLGTEIPNLDQEFAFVGIFGDDGESIHHFENQFVYMIKFVDYQFEDATN